MNTRAISRGFQCIRNRSLNAPLRFHTAHYYPRFFSSSIPRLASNVKKYTEQHEWIQMTDDQVGITDYAQQLLGDVVFVELPPVDSFVSKGDELGAVESVKSASDIYAPLSGQVFEVNEALTSKPSLINKSAEGEGWICKIVVTEADKELGSLLDEKQYNEFLEAQHDEESMQEAEDKSKH